MPISIGLAFLAGLVSFLSPCVFSLVPAYIGYLGGQASNQLGDQGNRRLFAHGVVFVLGFSTVFILFGLLAGSLGGVLFQYRWLLTKIGGIIVILLGIHMTGLIRFQFLEYDQRITADTNRELGFFSSFILGVSFSAGWSPCIGPILGAILTFVMQGGTPWMGGLLLAVYSAGMAIPFLLASLAVSSLRNFIKKYSKWMYYLQIAMGVLLIILGFLLFFGVYERLAALGSPIDFGL